MLVGGLFHPFPPDYAFSSTAFLCAWQYYSRSVSVWIATWLWKSYTSFLCYTHIPAQLRQKLAPRANWCFLKGHAWAQKGFRCFDPSSRSRRPGMLPSMSTSSSTPPYFSRRLLDQHLLDLLHQWFFLRLPCIRGSQSPKEIRVAALYWAASTCTSLF